MARQRSRRLGKVERAEAVTVAEDLLLSRTTERQVILVLVEQYAISEYVARKLIRKAEEGIAAQVERQRPLRRTQLIAGLDIVFNKAVETGRLSAAVSVLRLQAKVEGHERRPKAESGPEVPRAPAKDPDAEYANRTTEELEYCLEHGHWPEDAPEGEGESKGEEPEAEVFEFPLK